MITASFPNSTIYRSDPKCVWVCVGGGTMCMCYLWEEWLQRWRQNYSEPGRLRWPPLTEPHSLSAMYMGIGNLQDGSENQNICEIYFYLGLFGDTGSLPFTCIYNFIYSWRQLAPQEGVGQFDQIAAVSGSNTAPTGKKPAGPNRSPRPTKSSSQREMPTWQRGNNNPNNRHCWFCNEIFQSHNDVHFLVWLESLCIPHVVSL